MHLHYYYFGNLFQEMGRCVHRNTHKPETCHHMRRTSAVPSAAQRLELSNSFDASSDEMHACPSGALAARAAGRDGGGIAAMLLDSAGVGRRRGVLSDGMPRNAKIPWCACQVGAAAAGGRGTAAASGGGAELIVCADAAPVRQAGSGANTGRSDGGCSGRSKCSTCSWRRHPACRSRLLPVACTVLVLAPPLASTLRTAVTALGADARSFLATSVVLAGASGGAVSAWLGLSLIHISEPTRPY